MRKPETVSFPRGNACQVSDGAAALLIDRRSTLEKLGLPVFGVLRASTVVGVPPDVMGIGPAYAIPEALNQAGLTVDDIDVFEINEAFASQAMYCVEKMGIPMEKVNPNGGAIALGHPLGCTGARQVVTLLNELKHRQGMARCPCALGLEWERLQFLSILASDERSCLKIPR